jgi:hypothetical protein
VHVIYFLTIVRDGVLPSQTIVFSFHSLAASPTDECDRPASYLVASVRFVQTADSKVSSLFVLVGVGVALMVACGSVWDAHKVDAAFKDWREWQQSPEFQQFQRRKM